MKDDTGQVFYDPLTVPNIVFDLIKKPKRKSRTSTRRLQLLKRSPYCVYCMKELTIDNSTVDHVVPKSKGGTDRRSNLVLSYGPCNQKKANKTLNKKKVIINFLKMKESQNEKLRNSS